MYAYRHHELSPNVDSERAEMDAVLRSVERAIAVAVVQTSVLLDLPGLAFRWLTQPALTRTIALAHRKDINLSSAAEAMQALIIATVEDVAEQSPAIRSLT